MTEREQCIHYSRVMLSMFRHFRIRDGRPTWWILAGAARGRRQAFELSYKGQQELF